MFNILDIAAGALIFIVMLVIVILHKRITYNNALNVIYFKNRWRKLQKLCANRKLWYKAIVDADELVDEALKQRHFKGKTPGERMVSAQRYFTANDSLWLSHKLKNRIKEDGYRKLGKKQTLEALASFRLALKDLGALGEERKSKSKT